MHVEESACRLRCTLAGAPMPPGTGFHCGAGFPAHTSLPSLQLGCADGLRRARFVTSSR